MFLDSIYRYCKQESKGLSGASAANDLGISATTFNNYCNWRNSGIFPSIDTMQAIAAYISWDFDDVFLAVSAARFEYMSITSDLERHLKLPKNRPVKEHAVNL